mmetsp:Transcript_5563/g.16832  ORF Transcript_5563/g.16832 Transcript_5563/m.16832 type:complete len:238 (+) Transcript_5563:108-821(+)
MRWSCWVVVSCLSAEAFMSAPARGLRSYELRSQAVEGDYATAISDAKSVLWRAAETKGESSDAVVEALLALEKACRERGRLEASANAEVAAKLDGSWRLVFTTGTIDTQKKKTGRVNYFPVKAVQSFDMATNRIANGIFLGDLAALRFSGDFSFDVPSKKLQFDFDTLAIFGFPIPLNGGASRLGAATGLGSKNNENLVKQGKLPFFNWIDADDRIATARGGGGGLALWKRTDPLPV